MLSNAQRHLIYYGWNETVGLYQTLFCIYRWSIPGPTRPLSRIFCCWFWHVAQVAALALVLVELSQQEWLTASVWLCIKLDAWSPRELGSLQAGGCLAGMPDLIDLNDCLISCWSLSIKLWPLFRRQLVCSLLISGLGAECQCYKDLIGIDDLVVHYTSLNSNCFCKYSRTRVFNPTTLGINVLFPPIFLVNARHQGRGRGAFWAWTTLQHGREEA